MGGEIKLRRVDLRLDPDRYPVEGEKLDNSEKAVKCAADITKSKKSFHMALFAISAKGNVLRIILTTRHTIAVQGPGLATVLRETLLSNCVGIIVVEKAFKLSTTTVQILKWVKTQGFKGSII